MGELKPVDPAGQRWEDEACSVGRSGCLFPLGSVLASAEAELSLRCPPSTPRALEGKERA